jgi:CelD/BcsL family acetyltransferase involved in cellulose biosynthesis
MTTPRLSVWPPLPPTIYFHRNSNERPFPLDDDRCRLFARARHALWLGVQALGLAPGDEVLVPAYHHGSEVEALIQAGLGCRFYDVTSGLEPDPAELEALISPSTRALYLIHYLGVPQDLTRWRQWCDDRGLLLFEDAAQAWLASRDGKPAGSVGDLSIFCLYKTFGFPDGAALISSSPATYIPPSDKRISLLGRRHAAWAVGRSGVLAAAARRLWTAKESTAEDEFSLGEPSPPSSTLDLLIARVVDRSAAATRRAHYELLSADLDELALPAFRDLPSGSSPFAFPVVAANKSEMLDRMRASGIDALDFWSVPHPALPTGFPRAAELRRSVVGLPVHQELRRTDVERIARAVRGRSSPRSELTIERLSSLESVRDEWSRLAGETDNIFATWEWNSIWWRHHGRGRSLLAYGCRDRNGTLVAILPLYVSVDRPLRLVRFIGHDDADHLAPICRRADRGRAAHALRRALRSEGIDLFVGENVPAADGWAAFLGGKVLRSTGSPVLRFRGEDWDDVLARTSHNTRGQVRRRERKLKREHDVRFRLTDDRARLDDDLDTLFGFHTARWQGSPTRFSEGQAIHREFAHAAFDRGWLRLWILEVDGSPVSAWYGFRFGRAESYYQAGRNPAWDRYSVGFVLLVHSIRAALEDGAREYRFLEGAEPYKYRFTDDDPGLETVGVARGSLGGAALATISVAPPLAAVGRYLA